MMFMTPGEIRRCSSEELTTMLEEAGEASKHARKLGRVMGIVAAHRLKQMRELLMYEELAIWRRENGFDRAEESYFYVHRSLPPTPEQYYAGLWSEVNALRDAISMPRQKVSRLINATEQGKLGAEEYATLKRLLEQRVRETAQVTAVTRDDTVQHCSPCSPNPDRPSGVCFNLENNEGKMGQELEKLKSPSASTGLNTPGQQCPPNEGVWEQRRTIANGFVTASVDSSQGGRTPSPLERSTSTRTFADIFSTAAIQENRRRKTPSQQNKQFDPGGRGEKAPPWNAAVTLPFFSGGELGSSLLVFCLCFFLFVCTLCVLCFSVFPKLFFFSGGTSQQAESHEEGSRIKLMKHVTGGQAFSRRLPF